MKLKRLHSACRIITYKRRGRERGERGYFVGEKIVENAKLA